MAKSTRSKSKRAFRRIKRESSVFAAADTARVHRLSTKLRAKLGTDEKNNTTLLDIAKGDEKETPADTQSDVMVLDNPHSKRISTSGRRISRRDSRRRSGRRSRKH